MDGMADKTKLEELSGELPERERRDLLEKITRRIRSDDREEVVAVEIKEEERERLAREELEAISWWLRMVLWLQSVLTGRTRRDLFLQHKLSVLRHHIRQKSPGVVGTETRDLTPRFAQRLFDLYSAVHPLIGLLRSYHFQSEFQQGMIAWLVECRYPESRSKLEELVPLEEMEILFERTGSEEELRKLVLRRLTDYLKNLPERLFSGLDDGARPLYHLRSLMLFPFASLFRHFGYTAAGEGLDEKYPPFQHGPVMLQLDRLEKLFYALYLVGKLEKDWTIHEEALWYYCLHEQHLEEGSDELIRQVADLNRSFAALVREVEEFHNRVPVMEIIKYFRRDPYYRLAFTIPRFSLKTIYAATARSSFMTQLEEQLQGIKGKVIDGKIGRLFGPTKLLDLYHYVREPAGAPGAPPAAADPSRRDPPAFAHPRSLRILYNFLVLLYKGGTQEALHLTSTYLLSNNRIAQTRLMQFASGLEELEAKIVLFDRSLSSDEDDGKSLRRYRNLRPVDLEEQKLFRSFVAQKNREARDLIHRGGEDLQGIRRTFSDLLVSPVENVKSALKTIHYYRGKTDTLQQILRGNVELMTDFSGLLDQLMAVEKGS